MAASFSLGFIVFKINLPRLQKFRGLIGACQRPTRARQTSDTFPDMKSRKPEMSKNKMKLEVVSFELGHIFGWRHLWSVGCFEPEGKMINAVLKGHRHLSLKVQSIKFESDIKFLTLCNLRYTKHQKFKSNTHLHAITRPQI